uniref:Reverse transcriptase n=1 Tax=Solanum tuberosum TaxID=4113 RepID=M1BCX3_SOLTU
MPRSLLSSLNGSELRAQWIIRLKKVLAEVVSTSQNAFVEGKRILYAALVANKVMDSKIKQGVPGVLCKLDLEKACDHVNRKFQD